MWGCQAKVCEDLGFRGLGSWIGFQKSTRIEDVGLEVKASKFEVQG